MAYFYNNYVEFHRRTRQTWRKFFKFVYRFVDTQRYVVLSKGVTAYHNAVHSPEYQVKNPNIEANESIWIYEYMNIWDKKPKS